MTRLHWVLAGLIIALTAWIVFYQLGVAPFQDYDESTYAEVTREMRASGNLFLLTHAGEPYFEKPPLYFWLADASETVLGVNEFAMRFPSALSAVLLVAAVMMLTYELAADANAALLAGAILLTMAPLIDTARNVRMDVVLAFYIVLGAWAFLRGLRDPRWYLLFGAVAGLAVMTKSVVAVFVFAAAGAVALVWWRWAWIKSRWFWAAILLAVLIALPWHLYETYVYGMTFWREYFGYTVVTRSAQDVFTVQITNNDYIWYLSEFAAPWTQVFIVCAVAAAVYWREMRPRVRSAATISFLMVAAVIGVFFYAATKAPTYLIPLYPFAAMFIALVIAEALERGGWSEKIIIATATAMLLAGGGVSLYFNAFHHNPYYAQTDELAREERTIGGMISPSALFYAFDTTTLGSIMFYSDNIHPLMLSAQAVPGGMVVLPSTQLEALGQLYPNMRVNVLYSGEELALAQIVSD